MRGLFIALEGGEGAGKSTQGWLLTEHLRACGLDVVHTREPGGTPAAEAIRSVVLSPEFAGLDARSEALLFAAARGEHAARVIRPAIERGSIVVCDRYIDSSVAYQGVARDLGAEAIRELSLWATQGLVPDLTIVLDIDPTVGLTRIDEPDRLEAEPVEYHLRVRQAFIDLAQAEPTRYLVIDATQDVDAIATQIRARVEPLIAGRTGTTS